MEKDSNLQIISFRGQIIPMTAEQYEEFKETLEEWDN